MTTIDTKHIDAIEAWKSDRARADARIQALDSYNTALYWLKYALPKMAEVDDLARRLIAEGQRVLEDETEGQGEIPTLLFQLREEAGWVVNYFDKVGAKR